MITIKNYLNDEVPPEVTKMKEHLDLFEINGFIIKNIDDKTYDGCSSAIKAKKVATSIENKEIKFREEIQTIIFIVKPISKKTTEIVPESFFFAVSSRSNRRINNNLMKKEIANILKVSKSDLDIKKASINELKILKVSSGLINPFTEGVTHLIDIDLFKEYYYGEILTTNANHKLWSLKISLKQSKKNIIKKSNYFITKNCIIQ